MKKINIQIHKKNKTFLFIFFSIILTYIIFFALKFCNFNFLNIANSKFYFIANYYFILIPILSAFFVQNILFKENIFSKFYRNNFLNWTFFDYKLFLTIFSAIFLLFIIFSLDFFISLISKKILFSTDFNLIFQKYSSVWTTQKLEILKKFSTDFNIQFFWAINVFVGIIVGCTTSALLFWLEFLSWFGFLWKELKFMSFWQKNLYIGFFRGMIYAPFTFIGFFGKTEHSVFLALIILAWHTLFFPILGIVFRTTKSIIYPSIFAGIINSVGMLSTFFIVGSPELIIGFYGIVGILGLTIINIILYFDYTTKIKLIKNKIIHIKNKK